jgi:hypothetical protein
MAEVLTVRLVPRGVHADVIGGEALLISFVTGKYYKVCGTGAEVVAALVKGPVDPEAVIAAARTKYGLDELGLPRLAIFFDELKQEKLIEPYMCQGEPVPVELGASFNLPAIGIEDRLSELLTMDPIHEVGTEGWPNRAG